MIKLRRYEVMKMRTS